MLARYRYFQHLPKCHLWWDNVTESDQSEAKAYACTDLKSMGQPEYTDAMPSISAHNKEENTGYRKRALFMTGLITEINPSQKEKSL